MYPRVVLGLKFKESSTVSGLGLPVTVTLAITASNKYDEAHWRIGQLNVHYLLKPGMLFHEILHVTVWVC